MTRTRLGESENDCREASIRFTTYWSDPVKRISREFDFFLNERNRSLSENIPNRAKAANFKIRKYTAHENPIINHG